MSDRAESRVALARVFGVRHPWRCRGGGLLEDADVGQIPVPLTEIQTVADDKLIVDREADVVDLHVDLTARRLTEQTRGAKIAWRARTENVLQVGQGQAGVHDVFDDDDVASVEGRVEIFDELDFA